MAYEMKDNSGSLFRNDRKEQEKQPDHKGQGKVTCPACQKPFEMWISAWINTVKSGANQGKRYFGLKFEAKDNQFGQPNAPVAQPPQQGQVPFDEDVPF